MRETQEVDVFSIPVLIFSGGFVGVYSIVEKNFLNHK